MNSFYKGKKILVTGGAGFIGSHLCENLVEDALVDVIDDFSTGSFENVSGLVNSRIFESDCTDFKKTAALIRGYDIVFNLAGSTKSILYGEKSNPELLHNNTVLQLNVLRACRINRIGRLLMVSSSCVYSDDAPCPTPELPPFSGEPESANAGYGWAKRIGELAASYYHRTYKMDIAVVRPTNIYGDRHLDLENDYHVIPSLVRRVAKDQDPLNVWGTGEQSRDFLHVTDAVNLMKLVLARKIDAQPVNLGSGIEVKIKDLAQLICRLSGKSPRIVFKENKPQGSPRKIADVQLLREIAKGYYKPAVGLEEGIRRTISRYINVFKNG